MEREDALNLEGRIEQALENIESIEKETLSFAKSKKDLVEISKSLLQLIEQQKLELEALKKLVKSVGDATVEETLQQFSVNIQTTQTMNEQLVQQLTSKIADFDQKLIKEVLDLKQQLIMQYSITSKKQSNAITLFGVFAVFLFIAIMLLNYFQII